MPIRVRHDLCAIGTARVGTSASLLHVEGNSCRNLRFFSIIIKRRMLSQGDRSEEHTYELQSLMRISYAVFCLKKQTIHNNTKSSKRSCNIRNNTQSRINQNYQAKTQSGRNKKP